MVAGLGIFHFWPEEEFARSLTAPSTSADRYPFAAELDETFTAAGAIGAGEELDQLRRCRNTRQWADGDVHDVAIRLAALWTVIVDTAPASAFDSGVLADDRLLDWVAAAGRCRLSSRTP